MKVQNIVQQAVIVEPQKWFNNCHASTLLQTGDNCFLCAYMAGTREGEPDMAIWLSRCENGTWMQPRRIAHAYLLPHWNPVLFEDSGKVHLYYKRGNTVHDWYTMHMTSRDGGLTWTAPEEAIAGDHSARVCVRCKLIKDSAGKWMGPVSVENDSHWDSFVDQSTDGGATWVKHPVPFVHQKPQQWSAAHRDAIWEGLTAGALWEGRLETVFAWDGIIQPTMWESSPGHVHMMMRSTRGAIFRSDSTDGGATWCGAYATTLPNNNSGIDVARMENGALALLYNPVRQNWGKRSPLSISLSVDNGQSWTEPVALETQAGEYSYPAVIAKGDRVYFAYTANRKNIIFGSCCVDAR